MATTISLPFKIKDTLEIRLKICCHLRQIPGLLRQPHHFSAGRTYGVLQQETHPRYLKSPCRAKHFQTRRIFYLMQLKPGVCIIETIVPPRDLEILQVRQQIKS